MSSTSVISKFSASLPLTITAAKVILPAVSTFLTTSPLRRSYKGNHAAPLSRTTRLGARQPLSRPPFARYVHTAPRQMQTYSHTKKVTRDGDRFHYIEEIVRDTQSQKHDPEENAKSPSPVQQQMSRASTLPHPQGQQPGPVQKAICEACRGRSERESVRSDRARGPNREQERNSASRLEHGTDDSPKTKRSSNPILLSISLGCLTYIGWVHLKPEGPRNDTYWSNGVLRFYDETDEERRKNDAAEDRAVKRWREMQWWR